MKQKNIVPQELIISYDNKQVAIRDLTTNLSKAIWINKEHLGKLIRALQEIQLEKT